jgi:tellurite resistance protein TerC
MFFRTARQVVIAVIGGTVIALGIALIVLPGPAFIVIPAGVAILATEFAWARRLLKRMKAQANSMLGRPNPIDPPTEVGKRQS